jgi:toxin FitB
MILVDTNIISEMMKSAPTVSVTEWIDSQDVMQLYIAAITIGEIAYGLQVLADGKRRRFLEEAFDKSIKESFEDRILSFDEAAAHFYGNIMGRRKELGRPMSILDGQIAAIARANDCALATRNIKDFQNCDLKLIDPFKMISTKEMTATS